MQKQGPAFLVLRRKKHRLQPLKRRGNHQAEAAPLLDGAALAHAITALDHLVQQARRIFLAPIAQPIPQQSALETEGNLAGRRKARQALPAGDRMAVYIGRPSSVYMIYVFANLTSELLDARSANDGCVEAPPVNECLVHLALVDRVHVPRRRHASGDTWNAWRKAEDVLAQVPVPRRVSVASHEARDEAYVRIAAVCCKAGGPCAPDDPSDKLGGLAIERSVRGRLESTSKCILERHSSLGSICSSQTEVLVSECVDIELHLFCNTSHNTCDVLLHFVHGAAGLDAVVHDCGSFFRKRIDLPPGLVSMDFT